MSLQKYFLATLLNVLFELTAINSYLLENRHKRQADSGSTFSTPSESMTTSNTTVVEFNDNDSPRIGLVVGVICGVIALIAAMAIIATIWIRNKRSRDAEYERAAKVQLSSTQNAGVYNDLTTSPIVKKPLDTHGDSTEMDKLKNEDEEV